VTLPFALDIANKGVSQALLDNEHLRAGLNVHSGKISCLEVARDLGYEHVPALDVLNN
jgi:alanine dehydrogenase